MTKHVNRRRFLAAGAAGLMGAHAVTHAADQEQEKPITGKDDLDDLDLDFLDEEQPKIRKYNVLGKTGLKVSDISLGSAREASVFHYALDRGINFFDTAEVYYQGRHETDLGKALRPVRDKVVVTTKHFHGNPKKITKKKVIEKFDKSLKRLGFDHVDIAMLHCVDKPELFACEELLAAYEELKKAGKYRHLGFSTHEAEKICPVAFATGLFEVMMVIYNSVQYPERSRMIDEARKKGIGVIAMKTMMGREQDRIAELVNERNTFSQAAIKWALTDPGVQNVVISMRTFEHVDEYLKASGGKLTDADQEVLKKYVKAVDDRYCRIGCGTCAAACPHRVAVNDVMRFGMYFENYGEEQRAMQDYARLRESRRAAPCATCEGMCGKACPHGLDVRDRLVRYDGLLRA